MSDDWQATTRGLVTTGLGFVPEGEANGLKIRSTATHCAVPETLPAARRLRIGRQVA